MCINCTCNVSVYCIVLNKLQVFPPKPIFFYYIAQNYTVKLWRSNQTLDCEKKFHFLDPPETILGKISKFEGMPNFYQREIVQ